MRTSLRRRLMAAISASTLAAWLATALFTYIDTRREIDAMLKAGQVQSVELRQALAESVAAHLLHPLLVAVPVLGVVIWLSVGWGLAPLRALALQVEKRDPQNLDALTVKAPEEARPLVVALNGLFGRMRDLLERERRFTADAAHELRTPLAGIRTHAQVALAAAEEGERRQALDGVVQGTARATHLVEQLLELARLDATPAMGPVDVAAVAAQTVAAISGQASARKIDLGLIEADATAVVTGNAPLIAVLLRNLIDNAVRYGRPGGRVDVSVLRRPDAVELRVEDDGPGIASDQRAQVFARFHRGLGTGAEGSGLGLSIVARIAELHHARIELRDGIGGRGLAVVVSFPP